jgi:hypothetical protein
MVNRRSQRESLERYRFEWLDQFRTQRYSKATQRVRFLSSSCSSSGPCLTCFLLPTCSCDCGVFTLKFADYLSEDRPLEFDQSDMPYFRKRIVLELLSKSKLILFSSSLFVAFVFTMFAFLPSLLLQRWCNAVRTEGPNESDERLRS